MHRFLKLGPEPVDEAELSRQRPLEVEMGAVVGFLGVVRQEEQGKKLEHLEYEAFAEMAEHQFHLIFDEVERRWPVHSIRLVHRLGPVEPGQVSLWVELVAPHRGEAFPACQFLIDEMKKKVPIWKKAVFKS